MVSDLLHKYHTKLRLHAKRIVAGTLLFFVVFTLAGFFILPPLVKSVLTRQLSSRLHREVTIRKIAINPYALSLTVKGLMVKERASREKFVSCDEVFLNLQAFSALRMALVLKEIRLAKPYLHITRNDDLSYNFSDLIENQVPDTRDKKKSGGIKFSLNNIRIVDGSIDFLDMPKQKKHTVRELDLGVPFLSSIPSQVEIFVQPHFSAKINDTLYAIQGKTKPFAETLETSVDIDIKDLNIPYYLAYVPMRMPVKLTSAYLDTRTKLSFIQTKQKGPSLTVTGNLAVKKVAVDDEKNRALFTLPLLDVAIAPSEPLNKVIHLSKVLIQSPQCDIRRDEKGSINLQTMVPAGGEAKSDQKNQEQNVPGVLNIDRIELTGGKCAFTDLSTSKPFSTVLHPIEVRVEGFSTEKEKRSSYTLSIVTETKEAIKAEGQFSLAAAQSEGSVTINSVLLKKYSPFFGHKVLFAIDDGLIDLSTRYRFLKGENEPDVNLSAISLVVNGLRLKKTGDDKFLHIPRLSATETELNLRRKELIIGNLATSKGEVSVRRLADGALNIATLTPPEPRHSAIPWESRAQEKPIAPEKPWVVSLKHVVLDDYALRFQDHTVSEPVTSTLTRIKLKGENFSTAKNSRGKITLSFLLNGKGKLSTTGIMGINPLTATMKTDVSNIDIAPFQSYFTDKVRMNVTGGSISAAGNLSVATDEKKEIKADYKGDVSVANFSSIDKRNGQDLLKLESLSVSGLSAGYAPFSFQVKGIALSNFYALVLINSKGKINLQELTNTGESSKVNVQNSPSPPAVKAANAAVPVSKTNERNIRIEQVTLQGGRVDFVDRSVKPEFSMRLSQVGGRISGLSADEDGRADVELLTKLNDYAPLQITGKINPLSRDLFVDLKARIKDWDLSPVTPYSGKYAGYTIEKGKLSFDLTYLITKGKLDSQNDIFIDQFAFGEKIDSADATKLPVRLAVALLKDRNGQIKLDIPVTGSLNDPQFSVWRIIVKIVMNLVAKAATSPFALLGSVFGGGADLSYITFDYGTAALAEPDIKKLEAVTRALHDRPALKMDIEGHVDMEKDMEGLKHFLFNRKVKVQKLNELIKKGQPAVPVDETRIEAGEYEKYLKMAYKQEKFPKPKNVLGLAKDIPVSEMEKLMLTNTIVREGDLRTLASQRAMKVRDAILKSGQVEPERVFILEPRSLTPEKKEKIKESRVDFKLK